MKLELVNRQVILPENATEPFQCHASTLVRLPCGTLVAAWFAGLREGSEDTAIWLSRYDHTRWTKPQRVTAREGKAHWNPVLFYPSDRLWLFYKVGNDVHRWKTWFITSSDRGFTWSSPTELVNGDRLPRGPVKNKLLLASNGVWIAPGSIESPERWRAFVDRSVDEGKHWNIAFVPLEPDNAIAGKNVALWDGVKKGMLWECCLENLLRWDGVIQPTLWESSPGHIHMLLRSTRGAIFRSDSIDYGVTWSSARATSLPNNNSGIDLVSMQDGTLVLALNPVSGNWGKRYPLSLIVSHDNGTSWLPLLDLESDRGEYSYPAIISEGGVVHITYTWNRKNIVYCRLQTV
ncbi:hypothetical protein CDR68_13855 [Salmonella enterica]|nr:hypothetical protein [Salmonella enterica]